MTQPHYNICLSPHYLCSFGHSAPCHVRWNQPQNVLVLWLFAMLGKVLTSIHSSSCLLSQAPDDSIPHKPISITPQQAFTQLPSLPVLLRPIFHLLHPLAAFADSSLSQLGVDWGGFRGKTANEYLLRLPGAWQVVAELCVYSDTACCLARQDVGLPKGHRWREKGGRGELEVYLILLRVWFWFCKSGMAWLAGGNHSTTQDFSLITIMGRAGVPIMLMWSYDIVLYNFTKLWHNFYSYTDIDHFKLDLCIISIVIFAL